MSNGQRPPLTLRSAEQPPDDLDRLLHTFFRAELPDPWPTMPVPALTSSLPVRPSPRRWPGLRGRLALAAAVALLCVGYFTLARAFPETPAGSKLVIHPKDTIARKLDGPKDHAAERSHGQPPAQTFPTRNGRAARLWEQRLPGDRILIEVEEISGPQRRR